MGPNAGGLHPVEILVIELALDDAEELRSGCRGRGCGAQRQNEYAEHDYETGHSLPLLSTPCRPDLPDIA
jgi:hypothetical protein